MTHRLSGYQKFNGPSHEPLAQLGYKGPIWGCLGKWAGLGMTRMGSNLDLEGVRHLRPERRHIAQEWRILTDAVTSHLGIRLKYLSDRSPYFNLLTVSHRASSRSDLQHFSSRESPIMLSRILLLAPLLASAALAGASDCPIGGDTSIIAHTGESVGTEEVVDGSQCD